MEKKGGSGVLCVWVMEGMMWGVVWKGYEVKGVDGGGGYQNERIAGKTNSCWKGELKKESNISNEKPESHYIFYESLQSDRNTSAYLFARISISGESTNHHHNHTLLFTNRAVFPKQCL